MIAAGWIAFGLLFVGLVGAAFLGTWIGGRQDRSKASGGWRHSHHLIGNPSLRIWHTHPRVEHADTDNEILNVAPFDIQQ